MTGDARYRDWVERYVKAWNSNDPGDISSLFTAGARYFTEPYAEPWVGPDEIVREWLGRRDEPGDTTFTFDVLAATEALGIVRGEARYASSGRVYSNLWEVRLDESGDCSEFVEWWMEQRSG